MFKAQKRILYLIWYFILTFNILAIYRPYDIYRPGARSAAAGGTGVSSIDSVGSLSQNPAYLATIDSTRFSFAADAQTRITRIQTNVRLEPQFLPILAWGMPLGANGSIGTMFYTPFQRHFLQENFIYYNFDIVYAHTVQRYLSVGVTIGPGLGLQAQRFTGWGLSTSASLLFRHPKFSAGLSFRPGTKIVYSVFSSGVRVEERLPDLIKFGISKQFKIAKISLESEYLAWQNSYFKSAGVDETPDLQENFLGRFNLQLGAEFEIPYFAGLFFRTGLLTEDFYDYLGNNDRQVLFTLGIGGLTTKKLWSDSLKIDFSLMSSFLPSLFWKENHQIEKMQVSFEFLF